MRNKILEIRFTMLKDDLKSEAVIRKSSIIYSVFLVFLLAMACPAFAESPKTPGSRLDVGFEVQRYDWKEFYDNHATLLEEKGYLYGLTCDYDSRRNILGWRGGGDLFFGQVDYDGHTWNLVPVKTDVLYVGTNAYLDLDPSYCFNSGLVVNAFGGMGFKGWMRDLADTHTQDGVPVSGSREWWWVFYGRAGAGASYPVTDALELFSEAGVKLPVYARNDAYFFTSGNPSVQLVQKQDYSPFGDIGMRWKRLSVKLVYDSLKFKRSDSATSGALGLYQPESEAMILELAISWKMMF